MDNWFFEVLGPQKVVLPNLPILDKNEQKVNPTDEKYARSDRVIFAKNFCLNTIDGNNVEILLKIVLTQ